MVSSTEPSSFSVAFFACPPRQFPVPVRLNSPSDKLQLEAGLGQFGVGIGRRPLLGHAAVVAGRRALLSTLPAHSDGHRRKGFVFQSFKRLFTVNSVPAFLKRIGTY